MKISFDLAKDALNKKKHGISLADAGKIDWTTLVYDRDDRFCYDEDRYVGFGLIGTRLYCVVFTYRNDTMRVISLRKANKREQRDYEQA